MDREKYLSIGMHDYLSKPFLIDDLVVYVKKYSLLNKQRSLGSPL